MRKNIIFFLVVLIMGAAKAQPVAGAVWWASLPEYARYEHQLRLIDSLHSFCTDELKLNVGDSFYNTWISGGDSMFVFLYVSEPDTVAMPSFVKSMVWPFERESLARAKSDELHDLGYHTLVYKTAGTAEAFLNAKLLSYPDEAIAFIVFHEAVHKHVGQMVDYNYVEALCDAVATRATIAFAEKTGRLNLARVLQQKQVLEMTYAFLNAKRVELDKTGKAKRQKIFKTCNVKIKSLTSNANPFLKDRMDYAVNNAYFIRVQLYAIRYFEMYAGLGNSIDISAATTGLPGAEPKKKEKELKLPDGDDGSPAFNWGR